MIPYDAILDNRYEVSTWLAEQEQIISDDAFDDLIFELRGLIAKEISLKFHRNKKCGLIDAATGVGKSYFAIQECIALLQKRPDAKILLIVPTQELRDNNWRKEFEKWGALEVYDKIERVCYASMHKLKGNYYSFIILDEYHHITSLAAKFFKHNSWFGIMGLSATKPKEKHKLGILEDLGLTSIVSIPVKDAVLLKLVAPYKIIVVETRLNDIAKTVEIETKNETFKTTEKANYNYINNKIKNYFSSDKATHKGYEYLIKERMHFIYNLPSKREISQRLLDEFIPQEWKTLIFAGSTKRANDLCKYRYHSANKRYNAKHLDLFSNGSILKMSCANALNEGQNIPNLKCCYIDQMNASDRVFTQRVGRSIRRSRGHVGVIILLCCVDTQEKEWVDSALDQFDESDIERTSFSNILVGNYKFEV